MFDQSKFSPIGGQATLSVSVFSYRTIDTDTAITTPDYFAKVSRQLEPGDVILANTSGGFVAYTVLEGGGSVINTSTPVQFGAKATDDAGDGSAAGDINATDFTGHEYAQGTALLISARAAVTFTHKSVAYNYIGPRDVLVGVGGDYTVVTADLTGIGTADHQILVNLDVIDQHPIAAIIGLVAQQLTQDNATALVQANLDTHGALTNNPHQTAHADVLDRAVIDAHPTSAITSLDQDQTDQDAATALVQSNLSTHQAAADPHGQYTLETVAAATFTGAGYGGIGQDGTQVLPDLGAGWIFYTGFTQDLIVSPKNVTQDFANNGIIINDLGAWILTVKLTLTHNSLNAGRSTSIRFYNKTDETPGAIEFVYGIGRNTEVTNITIPAILFDVDASRLGKLFQIQIGGGDIFSTVSALGGFFSVARVSESGAF